MTSIRISINKDELVIKLESFYAHIPEHREYMEEIKIKPVVKVKQDKLIVCLRTEIPLKDYTYKIEVDK